jgi:competence protein ComEC
VAVISVGEDNRFGHPAPETLERLSEIPSYRTDDDGDITISTDGTNVWVDTQR